MNAEIIRLLAACDAAMDSNSKGDGFEEVAAFILSSIPGIEIRRRDYLNKTHSEEIDLLLWNDHDSNGLKFVDGNHVLVECKFWSRPVGASEVAWFSYKMMIKSCKFGILIAANGISGRHEDVTASYQILRDSLAHNREIVILQRSDLECIQSIQDFLKLIKEKLCDLRG